MKKYLLFVLALAVALSFSAPAMAKDGLSVEFGVGYNPNGADMGKTILKDGEDGAKFTAGTTGKGVIMGKAVLAQNELLIAKEDAVKGNIIAKVDETSTMSGIDLGLNVRYDFLNMFFAKVGFNYEVTMASTQKFTFTSTASLAFNAGGLPEAAVNGVNGKSVTQEWDYGYYGIPITVGLNLPVGDKMSAYAGIGITYYSGWWSLKAKGPNGYALSGYAPQGAFDETVKFEASGIGFNYLLGFKGEVGMDVSVFIEYSVTQAGGMSDKVDLKSNSLKAAMGVDNMYYPVNLSKSLFKVGASYRLPVL